MGNKKASLLTPDNMKKAERDLLVFSGLNQDEYEVKQVKSFHE